MEQKVDGRIATVLLVVATLGLVGTVFCAWGWWARAHRPTALTDLSAVDRQALVEDLVSISPGTFAAAWFEPRIAYTLKRRQQISAWNDTFESNALGYRTKPGKKPKGVYRILFVGDSWTYGMGVEEEQTFAHQVEELARQHFVRQPPDGRRVETWILALPGYNTLAQVSALRFFWSRLEPDAVVLCPTPNDHHSMSGVLPNGSLSRSAVLRDGFGQDHVLTYRISWIDSYRARQRWRRAFAEIRELETFLAAQDVPFWLFFTASWREPVVHRLVAEAGLEARYRITPIELTTPAWRNPRPIGHPNPAAHRLYSRMVYRMIAETLGWPALPLAEGEVPSETHHRPALASWQPASDEILRRKTEDYIATSLRLPSEEARHQLAGPLDAKTGLMGRATTVLVRRAPDRSRLAVRVRRLDGIDGLYPLDLRLRVPSAGGGSEAVFQIGESGEAKRRLVIDLPPDIEVGAALDVELSASHTVVSRQVLTPVSVHVEAIDQLAEADR